MEVVMTAVTFEEWREGQRRQRQIAEEGFEAFDKCVQDSDWDVPRTESSPMYVWSIPSWWENLGGDGIYYPMSGGLSPGPIDHRDHGLSPFISRGIIYEAEPPEGLETSFLDTENEKFSFERNTQMLVSSSGGTLYLEESDMPSLSAEQSAWIRSLEDCYGRVQMLVANLGQPNVNLDNASNPPAGFPKSSPSEEQLARIRSLEDSYVRLQVLAADLDQANVNLDNASNSLADFPKKSDAAYQGLVSALSELRDAKYAVISVLADASSDIQQALNTLETTSGPRSDASSHPEIMTGRSEGANQSNTPRGSSEKPNQPDNPELSLVRAESIPTVAGSLPVST